MPPSSFSFSPPPFSSSSSSPSSLSLSHSPQLRHRASTPAAPIEQHRRLVARHRNLLRYISMALTLTTAIRGRPADPAIILPTRPAARTITYARLVSAVTILQAALAGTLSLSRRSPPVSMALPNSPELAVAFLAVAAQRAVAAPLNSAYSQAEFEYYMADVGSALVLVPRGAAAAGAAAVRAARRLGAAVVEVWWDPARGEVALEVREWGRLPGVGPARGGGGDAAGAGEPQDDVAMAEPDDVALVLHTSGTTSRPKVVPLTHRNLTSTMKNIQETYQLSPADRTMLVMPLFHVHGLVAGLLAPLCSGGSVILPTKFSATDFWPDFIAHRATWYTAVPTIHQILLRNPAPNPVPPIRFIRSCSSPLPPAVLAQLEAAYHAPVLEAYAMTEAAHQMTSNPLPPARHKPGTVGVGQGVEVRILDDAGAEVGRGKEGEICVRADSVTAGYLNNEAANAASYTAAGFFRTGDQGRLDEDGYVVITGRIKELINKGGEKISPIELDNVLTQHPAVAEAVSFAVEHDLYGQEVALAVVLKPGQKLGEKELRAWMAERVAKFKIPGKIYFTQSMPKTATGKIQRRIVAATMLEDEKAREAPKAKL